MSTIRSKGTRIEKSMDSALARAKIDFVSHPNLFGKPDFAVPRHKIAIFCDGDFWHGYDFGRNPRLKVKNNRKFWIDKIRHNIARDRLVNRTLRREGWKILRFWEHELMKDPGRCAKKVSQETRKRATQSRKSDTSLV